MCFCGSWADRLFFVAAKDRAQFGFLRARKVGVDQLHLQVVLNREVTHRCPAGAVTIWRRGSVTGAGIGATGSGDTSGRSIRLPSSPASSSARSRTRRFTCLVPPRRTPRAAGRSGARQHVLGACGRIAAGQREWSPTLRRTDKPEGRAVRAIDDATTGGGRMGGLFRGDRRGQGYSHLLEFAGQFSK